MIKISESEWNTIKALAKQELTPTELAKKLKISLPAIQRTIKELLNKNFIKRAAIKAGKTRPYTSYSLNEFIFLIKALKNDAAQIFLPIDENLKIHLNIWKIPQQEFHYFIEEFLWYFLINKKEIKDIVSIAVFGSVAKGTATKESDIDILIINKGNVSFDKKKDIAIENSFTGKTKIVMAQIFTQKEFLNSYKKESTFIKEILSDMIIIYDKNNFLINLKNEFEKRAS